jgi:molybdopterin/thiamine biosynthesis adenylyltransferase
MKSRYSRLEQIELIGSAGLERLQRSTVAILGVGNIGGEAARHWIPFGGRVLLVDRDIVKEENLGTQGFSLAQLGMPKVAARAQSLALLNPQCRIEGLQVDLADIGVGRLRDVDLILCCLDSRRARALVNELATRLGIPWIDAAVDGSGKSFFARVAAYDPGAPDAACYLCPHDRASLGELMREGAGERCPVWRGGDADVASPTLAISALGAAVASVQVIWGLKMLLGQWGEAKGCELYFDPDRGVSSRHSLRRNPHCLFDHQKFVLTPFGRGVDDVTVRELFAAAEQQLGHGVTLHLHRRTLVTEMRCPACDALRRPYRMLEAMREEEAACACGATMQPVALRLLGRFGRKEAAACWEQRWAALGLPACEVVTATKEAAAIHFLLA